jgi:hypothetical protein
VPSTMCFEPVWLLKRIGAFIVVREMNAPMVFAPLIVILPLVALYLWMFRDMLHNDYLGPPPFVVSPVNGARYNWMSDFMILNVVPQFTSPTRTDTGAIN